MDPRVDPPVETGDYVVLDPSIATTLVLAFQYLGYELGTGTTPLNLHIPPPLGPSGTASIE